MERGFFVEKKSKPNIFQRKNLPRSVKVLGHTIPIKVVEHLEDGGNELLGAYNAETKTIFLLKGCDRSVLLHEIIHAILHLSGASEGLTMSKEESICLSLEHGLWLLIQ